MKKILYIFWNPGEKRPRVLVRLGLFATLYLVGTLILSLLLSRLGLNSTGFWSMTIPQLVITLMVTYGSTKRIDKRPFTSLGLHFSRMWWRDCLFGVLLAAILMTGIFLIEWAFGWITIESFFTSISASPTRDSPTDKIFQLVGILLVFISVAIYEELLIRGYLLKNLAEGLNHPKIKSEYALIASILISSMIFSLSHFGNPHASTFSLFNIFLAGLFFSLGILFTGELATPISLHFSWNFFQGIVFGFPVSGFQVPVHLIHVQQAGPAQLTGSAFGPEAGWIGTWAILIGSTATILRHQHRKGTLTINKKYAQYQKQGNTAFPSQ